MLKMSNESGKPTDAHHKLLQGDNANQIARRFARDVWRKRSLAVFTGRSCIRLGDPFS